MAKARFNNVKLGAFVIAGLVFLVILLYLIGKNRNIFGSNYELKARFDNAQGLVKGSNIRFAGIQAGTVKSITFINDTVIEVTLFVNTDMKTIIRKNAIASISTDGLVGNKVVNIAPGAELAALAVEGDILYSKKTLKTDEMLVTLNETNENVAVITAGLKETVARLNNSSALWALLNDNSIPQDLKASIANIHRATIRAGSMTNNLDGMVKDIRNGKGSLGSILTDTILAQKLNEAVDKITSVGDEAEHLAVAINKTVAGIDKDLNSGQGVLHTLLKDPNTTKKLNKSLDNIQQGTNKFNESMEALQHNFLLRGYFKRQDKKKAREQQDSIPAEE